MIKAFKFLMLAMLALVIIACAAKPASESTGQYLDSAAITSKVKAGLIDKLGAQGFAIAVKTYKDEVQLSGFVNNAGIRQRAGQIAASTVNVKHVRNDLIVK